VSRENAINQESGPDSELDPLDPLPSRKWRKSPLIPGRIRFLLTFCPHSSLPTFVFLCLVLQLQTSGTPCVLPAKGSNFPFFNLSTPLGEKLYLRLERTVLEKDLGYAPTTKVVRVRGRSRSDLTRDHPGHIPISSNLSFSLTYDSINPNTGT
jgi:hypothetical protein